MDRQLPKPDRLVAPQASTSRLITVGSLTLPTPSVMGILNVTPDSFSDGGQFVSLESAVRQSAAMAEAGAAIIDIGGESTRPGADEVVVAKELERVIPVIEAIKSETDLPISIDTSKPQVMYEAVSAGAGLINDVMALQLDGALPMAAELGVPICLMHMQGKPRTMQEAPKYDDVAAEVTAFLTSRVAECIQAGIPKKQLIVDPGFGFGKTLAHNLELLSKLGSLAEVGVPVLVGLSRKRSLGEITGRDVDERVAASVAAAVIAVMNGAAIVRAHDVKETVDAIRVTSAVMEAGQ